MYDYNKRVQVIAGIRNVDEIGPKGGKRRRFQVWVERRDGSKWDPHGGGTDHCYGEIFARQWEAAQAARIAVEQARALERVFQFLTGSDLFTSRGF